MDVRLKMAVLIVMFFIICIGLWIASKAIFTWFANLLKWNSCKNTADAEICGFMDASEKKSSNLVEKEGADGCFRPVTIFQDPHPQRSVLDLFHKRSRMILQWKAGGASYKAYYPYPRDSWSQKPGQTLKLHYDTNKPWIYAITDQDLERSFLKNSLIGAVLVLCGICMIIGLFY